MRYEHLLQVTDPGNPQVPPMSRAELWRGLLVRVDAPQRFPLGPDRCELHPCSAAEERRRSVHFGSLRFDDRVELAPERALRFRPQPHEGALPVTLDITIEEPAPGALFLRFVYASDDGGADDEALQKYRELAWLELDRDMLTALRTWQRSGQL